VETLDEANLRAAVVSGITPQRIVALRKTQPAALEPSTRRPVAITCLLKWFD
jgi:hypothetical protein